mgnify:FL=1
MSYNGWTNYATWLAKLWIDENGYDPEFLKNKTRFEVQEDLKSYCTYLLGAENDDLPGFLFDVLQSYLSDVYWYELADHLIEEKTENMK